ncbi:uncharacterized protein K02A2.6-like [Neodiprion lecontei]|uniref:Uncharacterized protein K02A2.6-like n=1 Tax=Neodiprion lecontei TaxID=441921 RepID=A0A6J0B8W3_NEOLC|nr:uncharacterized protein K02A2.6-like [Neodiprion lecontei]
MEVDSGANVAAVPLYVYNEYFRDSLLLPPTLNLRSYDDKNIAVKGVIIVSVHKGSKIDNQKLYVIDNNGHPIVGREWLYKLKMWPIRLQNPKQNSEVNNIRNYSSETIEKLKKDFKYVLTPGFGLFTKGSVEIQLKSDAKPKFMQPYKVPISLKPKVEAELHRLKDNNIIQPINYSEWGTPIIPLLKKDGSTRIVGNYKVTVNPFIIIDHFPMPRIEEIFSILAGGIAYSVIDFSEAFLQMPVDEKSQEIMTIVTHIGLYKRLRLWYGIATGPGSFQRAISTLLIGIPNVPVLIDDIIVTAKTTIDHCNNLYEAFKRLNEAGLKINFNKCKFSKQI